MKGLSNRTFALGTRADSVTSGYPASSERAGVGGDVGGPICHLEPTTPTA